MCDVKRAGEWTSGGLFFKEGVGIVRQSGRSLRSLLGLKNSCEYTYLLVQNKINFHQSVG